MTMAVFILADRRLTCKRGSSRCVDGSEVVAKFSYIFLMATIDKAPIT